jgi:hypothetical protein
MGYTTSTVHGIEVPDSSEANHVPEDVGKVVTALEGGSIIRRLTGAAIAALTAPQKPAGTYFHNTTTGRLQVSDGTNVTDVGAPVYAVGTSSATLALSWSKTVLTYDAETDPFGMLASGVFTVPSAGLWLVNTYFTCDTGGPVTMNAYIELNAALYAQAINTSTYPLNASAVVVASASDQIRVRYTGSPGYNILSARTVVVKIGT